MKIDRLSRLVLLLIICLCSAMHADDARLTDARVWHGSNGKHFRGQYLARDGDVLTLSDSRGKIYKVPLNKLSEDDRKWFAKAWEAHQQKKNTIKALVKPGEVKNLENLTLSPVAAIGFKKVEDSQVTRLNIPLIDQAEYHDEDFNNDSSSMVPFMLWWHTYKVCDVPATRDDNEKRIKWLYSKLNRYNFMQSRYLETRKLQEFFQKELKTSASFETIDLRDSRQVQRLLKTEDRFSPEFLSKYTQGANATILSLPVYKKGRMEWTAEVPLVKCSPSGEVLFYMYGNIKMSGKMEKLPLDKKAAARRGDQLPRYEIKIDNMGDAPEWFQDREYTFFLEGKEGTGLTVIVPHVAEILDEPEDK